MLVGHLRERERLGELYHPNTMLISVFNTHRNSASNHESRGDCRNEKSETATRGTVA